jgi:hypothetical protein
VHVAGLSDFLRTFVLLHARVDVLDVAAVLAASGFALLAHQVLLGVFKVVLALVVEFAHLLQLVELADALLTHQIFSRFLGLLEFLLNSHFLAYSGLHDLSGHASVDSHDAILFALELFFGDGNLLEVVSLFIFGEPLGQLVMILEVVAIVGVINNFIS